MAITILQQPQALTFVGNIPELIVQTDGLNMTVNISIGEDLILSESYTADADGRARVRLRDFCNEYLKFSLPAGDLFEQTGTVRQFDVEIIVGTDTEELSFVAIKGGVDKALLDCSAYLQEAWLTWQPQSKQVRDVDPEWLSYFAVDAATVKVKAYFPGGATETIDLHSLEAAKQYTINMCFSDIREEFVEQPIYFDTWVVCGEEETYHQRYILTDEAYDFDDLFVFENSVGGLDTIRLTGEKRAVNPVEVDAALFYDEHTFDYQVNPNKAFEKNTGYFRSKAALYWAQDFFQAIKKYLYLEEELIQIQLRNPEIVTLDKELVDFDFKFSYTRQTTYLALFKKKSPLIDPVIIGPGDEEYYLPPKISDFPQLDDPTDTLFPVQIPGTPGWFFLTWQTILDSIYGGLPPIAHNSTTDKQGGDPENDFYGHLTENELEKVKNLPTPQPEGDRVVVAGTLEFDSITSMSGEDWSVIVGGNNYTDFNISLSSVPGLPSEFTRRDIVIIDPTGVVSYIAGLEYSEGVIQPQTPSGSLLLAFIDRDTEGGDTIYVTPAELSNYVSKSDLNLQTIQSDFALSKMVGSKPNFAVFGPNGEIQRGSVDQAGVYSTLQGIGGYSRILTILVTPGVFNYDAIIEFSGVSNLSEKGFLWVAFSVDSNGAMVNNKLQTFGKFTLSKYKLVRVDSFTYELFAQHDDFNAFFKFRPQFNFGGSTRYIYYHLHPKVDPLPAGTQYDFVKFSELNPHEIAAIQTADSPSELNAFVTISKLSSYSYIQEAPTDLKGYVRINEVWSQVSPYHLAQVGATDGQVLTWSAVNNRYEPSTPSGGGSSLWNEESWGIYRNVGSVIIGTNTLSGSSWSWPTFAVQSTFSNAGYDYFELYSYDGTLDFAIRQGTGVLYLRNPTLSFGTSATNLGIRHRATISGNGGSQFLIEDSNGVMNFNVDNIGRVTTRNALTIGGYLSVSGASVSGMAGAAIKGTNDGVDAFRLYVQNDTLVTYYRRTLGWIFKGYGTTGPVISIQDSTAALKIRMDASGRMFLHGIPATVPISGTNEVYVDSSGFLKLAV